MSKPTPERNKGARIERHADLAAFRQFSRNLLETIQMALEDFEATIQGRAKRTAKRAGGVGRK